MLKGILRTVFTPLKFVVDKVFNDFQEKAMPPTPETAKEPQKPDSHRADPQPQAEGSASRTTKRIAYILMGVYCLCLATLLAAAISFYSITPDIKDGVRLPRDTEWLRVFKDSFAFLGGLLATIVGYYFGNRNVNDAIEKAKKEEAKAGEAIEQVKAQEVIAGQAIEQVKAQEATVGNLKSQIADILKTDDDISEAASPISDENSLVAPTIPPILPPTP